MEKCEEGTGFTEVEEEVVEFAVNQYIKVGAEAWGQTFHCIQKQSAD